MSRIDEHADGPRLYVTITTKPLEVAAIENLPSLRAHIDLTQLDEANLVDLMRAAQERLEALGGTS